MKRVHWYDDDPNLIPSNVLSTASPSEQVEPKITLQGVAVSVQSYSLPIASANGYHHQQLQPPEAATTTLRLQIMYDKVNDVFRRMHMVRQRVQSLSQEMDDQLEETRQTKAQLTVVRAMVEQLRRETQVYDEQLKEYYEYERKHSTRTRRRQRQALRGQ
ncbi:hypothetical protein MPSEU_000874100 [Mayamaea pseudoterrestris]|nr:hypothetical protein MPSEU_000874100 [Mayamaea pseudoterrestris]